MKLTDKRKAKLEPIPITAPRPELTRLHQLEKSKRRDRLRSQKSEHKPLRKSLKKPRPLED